MPLWLPPGGEAMLRTICGAFSGEGSDDFLDEVFDVREYDPSEPLEIGDLALSFRARVHYVDAYAIRGERGGASIVYSARYRAVRRVVERARQAAASFCAKRRWG